MSASESVDEILNCDHSIFSCRAVYHTVQDGATSTIEFVDKSNVDHLNKSHLTVVF